MGTMKTEINDPNSCLNRSKPNEPLFVLCARDACAPGAILEWARLRIALGLNDATDEKMNEAIQIAQEMHAWRETNR